MLRELDEWIKVDNYSEVLKDQDLCWVLFPCGSKKLCRLNKYKPIGPVDFWQEVGTSNDLFMNMTKFIPVYEPSNPSEIGE